jgi:addiction module RelB/DinJ family antitoxin
VLAACGLEPSDAIRLFLQQVVAHQGIPFDIRSVERAPSMAELRALKRQSQERNHRLRRHSRMRAECCGQRSKIRIRC